MMTTTPAFYLSHGSPMRVLEDTPARHFLQNLGQQYDPPKGIVIISPHWESKGLRFTQQKNLQTIHDFWGFPEALNRITYPANNPIWLQDLLRETLTKQGIEITGEDRGLDHGAWSVLHLMYPQANIPVIGLSLPSNHSLKELYQLGLKLKSLRQQGIMIITTGLATHNLSKLSYHGEPDTWALEFAAWVQEKVATNDLDALFNYRHQAPWASTAHPTDEHFRPLFISLGAGGTDKGNTAQLLHESWELKNANNSSWGWS